MTDIKEAQGLEVVCWTQGEEVIWHCERERADRYGEPLCSLPKAQAVIDQLREELNKPKMDANISLQLNQQLRERVAELTESLDNYRAMLLDSDAELAATKEHLHTVEPEFHSLQATRNMAEKTVEIMIRRAESAEAELAALKAQEPVGIVGEDSLTVDWFRTFKHGTKVYVTAELNRSKTNEQ